MSSFTARRKWFFFAFLMVGLGLVLSQAFPAYAEDVQPRPMANPDPDCQPVSFTDDPPDPVAETQIFWLKVEMKNNSGIAGDNVTGGILRITLPENFTYTGNYTATHGTCTFVGTNPGDGGNDDYLECTGINLGPLESAFIDMEVQAPTGNLGTYTSYATTICSPDANSANDTESNQITVRRGADIQLTKTVNPTYVADSGIVTYTIQVTNAGPSPAPDLEFQDTLPSGLEFFADDANPPADDDNLWTCSASGSTVTCTYAEGTGGEVASGDTMTFHFRAKANAGVDGTVVNNAVMNILSPPFDQTLDPDPNNNLSSATLEIGPGTDLSITKTVSPDPVLGGTTATFTLDVENLGPRAATDVTVQDTLPTGYTIDNVTAPSGWTCTTSGTTVTCTKATMGVGETGQFIIEATPPNPSNVESHTNTATIAADAPPDPLPDNNTASVTYDVSPSAPNLVLEKDKAPNPVAVGGQITNSIRVRNDGPVQADAPIVVVDRLSGLEDFDSAPTGAPWNCSYDSGNHWVTCTLVDSSLNPIPLAPGAEAPLLEIHTIAQSNGPITNTSTVSDGANADFDTTNNTDQATVNGTNENADLEVTKTVDDTFLDATETTLTFTITITNNGPDAASAISFDDVIPFYMPAGSGRPETPITVLSHPSGSSCNVTDDTLHCDDITLNPGDTATVVYTVERPMRDGTFVNDVCAYSGAIGDLVRTNNCDNAPAVTVAPIADVEVTQKTATFYDDGSGKALAGTSIVYTIQVRNNGPSTATNVELTDVFSGEPAPYPAFTFLSGSVSGGGSCTFNGTDTVTCTLGDMDVDQVKTVTIEIRPTHVVPEPDPWHMDNLATVTTNTDESDTTNNSQSKRVLIKGGLVDVTIEKNESPDFVEPVGYDPGGSGNYIVYEVVVTNFGPSYATDVTVTDRVDWVSPAHGDEQMRFVGDTANSDGSGATQDWCTIPAASNPFAVDGVDNDSEPLVTCSFPDLAPGASATRYLVFEVLTAPHPTQGDVYKNESYVTVAERETDDTNNAEDERTTVRVYADIAVTKSSPSPVEIYTPFNMTIEVTNYGPGIAPNARLSDTLPSGMVLTGPPTAVSDWGDTDISCTGSAGDGAFTCTLGHVGYDTTHTPQRETITITVPVMITDPGFGTQTNTATATSDAPEKDPDPHANSGSASITLNDPLKLGDFVWYDQDQDGIQDSGEPGINGVEVTLYNTPDCSGSPYAPDVGFANPVTTGQGTWPDGYYEFYPLPPGTYCVKFDFTRNNVLPGHILSPADQGSDDTVDSDATGSSGVYTIQNIDLTGLAPGTADMTNDMGVYVEGTIGDRVWCESPTNVNATFDPADGDTGINDVTVTLYEDFDCDGAPDGGPLGTTTTTTGGTPSADGFYQFTGLQVAMAGSSSQTCYVVEVDTNDPDLGNCFLPDTPDDGEWNEGEKSSLDLDTDNPNADDVDFSFRWGDFGDLPDSGSGSFLTTLADNGPYHLLDEDLYLGDCADAENDGQPDDPDAGMNTGGDDGVFSTSNRVGTCSDTDDEDGIVFVRPFIPGQQSCIEVTAHNATGHAIYLYGWADWNGDGVFTASERLSGGDFGTGRASIPNGGVSDAEYCFDVPNTASFQNGDIHFRFRLTTESLSAGAFDGPASNGEVEDYWLPLACVGNYVWDDGSLPSNSVQDGSDTGLSGVPVRLVWAGPNDTIETGAGDASAAGDDVIAGSTTTDANGRYMFCGIAPPSQTSESYTFQVQVPSFTGLRSVTADTGGDDALDSDATPSDTLGAGWTDAAFTIAPDFSPEVPGFTINGSAPPTGEAGNEDANSEASDNGYPDERTDWTHDFGFTVFKDYGDLPESGTGSFHTTSGAGGPWHWVTPDLYLGRCVDVETDGQPDDPDAGIFSGGDDGTTGFGIIGTSCTLGDDDEDGVTLTTPLIPGQQACVRVTAHNATGNTAYLYAWFDWNGNGTFDAGEQLNTGDFSGGSYAFTGDLTNAELCFTVPSSATFDGGEIHYRFRLTTDSTLSSPDGGAADGEVEDYWTPITCVGSHVWEDRDMAGDQDTGEPSFVGMTVRLVFAGDDDTIDTQATDSAAQNDDTIYTTTTDGNGNYMFCGLTATTSNGQKYQVQIPSDGSGLYATDADATGVPDDQDSDGAPEHTVDNGWAAPEFVLTLDDAQPGDVAKDGGAMPTGEAGLGDGTVDAADHNTPDARDDWTQDFGFMLYHDYGDLPESGNGVFPTTLANDGPYHRVIPDLYLGDCVDVETDGQPGARAGAGGSPGDDSSVGFATEGSCLVAGNDEDGLTSAITPAAPGGRACFQVKAYNNTGVDARLYAWMDWDGDGQFQSDEQLTGEDFASGYATITDGTNGNVTVCFTMPAASDLVFEGGEIHTRLRLTTEDLSARGGGYELWEGPAADGEVEDYWAPLACVGNYLWLDTGATPSQQDGGDSPFANVPVRLVWAGPNGTVDTQPYDASAGGDDVIILTTTTDANGRYMFCGLGPGIGSDAVYQVQVPPIPGYLSVAKDSGSDDALDSDAAPGNSLASGWAGDAFGLRLDYTAAPGYILKDGSVLPTSEGGNEDANSEANDNGFPDERTDWTQDFGFIQYDDYGDLPASFEGGNPAVHPMRPDLYLGSCVDAETTNAPDNEAGMDATGGDDNTAGDYTVGSCTADDEDGVTLTTPLIPNHQACVRVTARNGTGSTAYLYAWFDWNGNGTFDAGEQLNTGDFSGGSYALTGDLTNAELCFTVPSSATFDGGEIHYRFRLTTQSDLASATGPATDGEVEDYWTRVACVGNLVWNDSTGTAQDVQDAADTGVSGQEMRLVWAGANDTIDTQPQHSSAQGDDRLYTVTTDANGVYAFCGVLPGTYQVQIVGAPSGLPQAVMPDVGTDDTADSDGAPVVGGVTSPAFTITDVTALPTGESSNQDAGNAYPNNFPDQQVDETIDFGFRPVPVDYGDLPNSYGTDSASNGPAHTIDPNLYLGGCVDAELDGQPSTDATGDDANAGYYTEGSCTPAGDDEDGVELVTPLVPGAQACIKVTARNAILPATNAYLYAWFDWNNDGDFLDADEMLNTGDFATGSRVTIPSGGVSNAVYCFDVPTTATFDGGEVHMRFRLTTDTLTAPTGTATDGEVEDYYEPLYCVGNFVWNDGGSPTPDIQDGSEPGIGSVTLTLRWDGNDDGDFADAEDRTYTTTTDSNGFYTFCGLVRDATRDGNADAYRVDVTPPAGLTPVAQDQGTNEALDSDGDASGVGPTFTLPPSPDVDTASNDADPNSYPDARTHLAVDFGFAAYDFGDLPSPYATTLADNGPRHVILPSGNPTLGAAVDPETDGQPNASATGDDTNGSDDEDGVTLPTTFVAGQTYTITCTATNAGPSTVVSAWIDWNGDGDFADPGEQVLSNASASSGCPSVTVTVPLDVAPNVGVRYRIANESLTSPTGAAGSGEVEDYRVTGQLTYDFGDAPDTFDTTDAAGGPKHQLNANLYLGGCVDGDDDGQPDPDAGVLGGGDDTGDASDTGDVEIGPSCTGGDDEDGVTLLTSLLPGAQACIEVDAVNNLGTDAYLYAWIDWNGDGAFDASERVDTGDFSGGSYTVTGNLTDQRLCFTVPTTATFDGGEVHMRFRLTTDTLAAGDWGGTAGDGEVEDYWTPLACAGNYVWDDTTSTTINEQDASDVPLENVTVELTTPGVDGTLGTADDITVSTTTDANGRYVFCGLRPGIQAQLRIPTLPAGLNQPVVPDQGADDTDSDATQPGGLGAPVEIGPFDVPALTDLAANNWVTGEGGNEDAATQGDPALTHNYPDGRVNLTFDFGLRNVPTTATKTLVDTDQTFTSGSDVAIGEIVTYQVTLTLEPGIVDNLTLTDILDQGLAFVACDSITVTGSLTATAGSWSDICNNATVSEEPAGSTEPVDQGRRVTWSFGTVTNSGVTDATITVTYRAVVLDSADNVSGQTLDNQATWTWDAGSQTASADPVTIVEPDLVLTKAADPQVAMPDEPIRFTLTVTHSPTSEVIAYDVVLHDELPDRLQYVDGTLVATSGPAPVSLTYDPATHTIEARWDEFPMGATTVIEFEALIVNTPDNTPVTNTAWLGWTSLPCDNCYPGDPGYTPLSPYNDLAHERAYDPPDSGYVRTADIDVYWVLPETGFAPGRVTVLPDMPQGYAYQDLGDLWLEIPRLGVQLPIIGIPRTAQGWDLTWLGRDAAGHLQGTTFPTWEGNAVITAHVFQADGLPGPFHGLGRLQWGDRILVHFQGRVYVYEVREAFRTDPYSTKPFRAPSEGYSWLTLFTCQGYDDALGGYRWRVVVQAVLVDVYDE